MLCSLVVPRLPAAGEWSFVSPRHGRAGQPERRRKNRAARRTHDGTRAQIPSCIQTATIHRTRRRHVTLRKAPAPATFPPLWLPPTTQADTSPDQVHERRRKEAPTTKVGRRVRQPPQPRTKAGCRCHMLSSQGKEGTHTAGCHNRASLLQPNLPA